MQNPRVVNRHQGKSGGKLKLDYLIRELGKEGILTEQQALQLLKLHKKSSKKTQHPLIFIADQGLQSATKPPYPLTIERLTKWLAEKTGIPYVRIDPLKIEVNKITSIISQAYAANLQILPIEVSDTELTIASCEPFFDSWEEELAGIAGLAIKRVLINPADVQRYLVEFYGISRSIIGATLDKSKSGIANTLQNFEQMMEVGKMGEPDANDQHIVSIVDWLLQFAFEQRASDIHMEPRREKGKVRFRIDGVLHQVHEFPTLLLAAISSRLKALGRMDVTDRRRPQDGRIKTKTPTGDEVEMRLSTMPTAFGEKLVVRIFDPDMLYKTFTQLGFTKHDFKHWKAMTENPHGLMLVTGPTGSGKTTTLYSALKQLAKPEYNICTIEDPIEMVDEHLNQMQVQKKIDVDFASGVRTLLRQDPDIIMIGEIRDLETADVAVQAALTGHLVLSTLHTNNAPAAISRLIELGVQPFLINAALLGILAQRLVRTLCPHCKQPQKISQTAWDALVAPAKLKLPENTCKAVGCDECRHTGYFGRIGIYEILPMTKDLHKLVVEDTDLDALRTAALKGGMRSLCISGAQKIATGLTTLEEVFSVVPPESN